MEEKEGGERREVDTAGGDGWQRLPPELWLRIFALGRKAWGAGAYVETLCSARLSCKVLAGLLLPEAVTIACLEFGRWDEALEGRDPGDETDEAWGRLVKEAESCFDAWDGADKRWGPLLRALMTVPPSTPRGERATRLVKRRLVEKTFENRSEVPRGSVRFSTYAMTGDAERCLETGRLELLTGEPLNLGPGDVQLYEFSRDFGARGRLPRASSAFLRECLVRRLERPDRVAEYELERLAAMPDALVSALDPAGFFAEGVESGGLPPTFEKRNGETHRLLPLMAVTCWDRTDLFDVAWDRCDASHAEGGTLGALERCARAVFCGANNPEPRRTTAALDRWAERLEGREREEAGGARWFHRLIDYRVRLGDALRWYTAAFPRAVEAWASSPRDPSDSARFVTEYVYGLSRSVRELPVDHPVLVAETRHAAGVLREEDNPGYLESWWCFLATALDSGDPKSVSLVLETMPRRLAEKGDDASAEAKYDRPPERLWNPDAIRRASKSAPVNTQLGLSYKNGFLRRWTCEPLPKDRARWDPSEASRKSWLSVARETTTLGGFLAALRREGIAFRSRRSAQVKQLVEGLIADSLPGRLDVALWALKLGDELSRDLSAKWKPIDVLGAFQHGASREALSTFLGTLARPELKELRGDTREALRKALRGLRADESSPLGASEPGRRDAWRRNDGRFFVLARFVAEFVGRGWMHPESTSDYLVARFGGPDCFAALERALNRTASPADFPPFGDVASTLRGLKQRAPPAHFGFNSHLLEDGFLALSWFRRRVFSGSPECVDSVLVEWLRLLPHGVSRLLPSHASLVTPGVLKEWRDQCAAMPSCSDGFLHPRIAALAPESHWAWLDSEEGRSVKEWLMRGPEWASRPLSLPGGTKRPAASSPDRETKRPRPENNAREQRPDEG